jgi:hypothetical protein
MRQLASWAIVPPTNGPTRAIGPHTLETSATARAQPFGEQYGNHRGGDGGEHAAGKTLRGPPQDDGGDVRRERTQQAADHEQRQPRFERPPGRQGAQDRGRQHRAGDGSDAEDRRHPGVEGDAADLADDRRQHRGGYEHEEAVQHHGARQYQRAGRIGAGEQIAPALLFVQINHLPTLVRPPRLRSIT